MPKNTSSSCCKALNPAVAKAVGEVGCTTSNRIQHSVQARKALIEFLLSE